MAADFTVGQKVRAKEAIYEPADDYAPAGYLCMKGDVLVVRKLDTRAVFPIKVSHEDVTDCSFGAKPEELEPLPDGVNACPSCDGLRFDVDDHDGDEEGGRPACPECNGTGRVPAGVEECPECGPVTKCHGASEAKPCPLGVGGTSDLERVESTPPNAPANGVRASVKPGDCIHCGKDICNDLGWCNSFKAAHANGVMGMEEKHGD